MIACLRSNRFMYPDRSRSIFLELRRRHDIQAQRHNKQFSVMRRTNIPNIVVNKNFDTIREARVYWIDQAKILTDQGLVPMDFRIVGFHEED